MLKNVSLVAITKLNSVNPKSTSSLPGLFPGLHFTSILFPAIETSAEQE